MKVLLTLGAILTGATLTIGALYVCDMSNRQQRVVNSALLQNTLSTFIHTSDRLDTSLDVRMTHYSILQRLSPFFALSGTDPEKLATQAEQFPLYGSQMLALFPDISSEIEDGLYPDHLFTVLPALESARREVIEQPTYHAILRHDQLLRKTFKAYEQDISEYETALYASATPDEQDGEIHFLGGVTSVKDITDALSLLQKEISRARTIQNERIACVRGDLKKCEILPEILSKLTLSNVDTVVPTTPPEAPPAEVLAAKEDIQNFLRKDGEQELLQERIFKLPTSPCKLPLHSSWYLMLTTKTLPSHMVPLDDVWFYDIGIFDDLEQVRFTGALYEMKEFGANYIYQNIGNLYFCPHNAENLARALTALAVKEDLKTAPLFSGYWNNVRFQSLSKMEDDIVERAHVDSEKIAQFLQETSLLLTREGERALSDILGFAAVLRIERLIQTWKEQSGHMDIAVAEAIHTNTETWYLMKASNMTPFGFMVSRAYPYLFFMPTNTSVTRNPVYFGNDTTKVSGLTSLSEIRTRFGNAKTQEELLKVRQANTLLKQKYPTPR